MTTTRRQLRFDIAKARTGEPRFGLFVFRAILNHTFRTGYFLPFLLSVLAVCRVDSAFAQNTLSTTKSAQQVSTEYEVTFFQGLISLRVDNAKLKPLLEEIGRKTGVQITVSADLGERTLSVRVSNLDLESALRAVLKSAGIESHAWVYRPSQKAGQLGKWELSTIHVVAQGSEWGQPSTETPPQQRAASEKPTLLPAKTVPGRELYFDKRSNKYVEVAEREVQVRFKKELSEEEIAETLRRFGATVISKREKLKIYRFKISATESVASFIEKHAANDKLVTLEPNFFASSKATVLPPNDPLFSQQWALQKIEAPKAWEVTTGSPDVVVAVIDTGIDHTHPDLRSQVLSGRNVIEQNDNATDDHGHGTAMAGVIAASANNAVGISGVCWLCRVMPVKVLDASGEGTYADVIEGVLWAADNGARILNLSLGGYVYSQLMADAVDYAHAAGAVIVAAGGNEDTSDPLYPAAFPNVIGVSATKQDDADWSPSNQGSYIKLSAPGFAIFSTSLNGREIQATGTSLSTAHVSGVTALILSKNSDFSNTQIEQILYRTADDLGEKGEDQIYGYGRVNAANALQKATVEVHDVAISRIGLKTQTFKVGEATQIVVTVENQGTFVEQNLFVETFVDGVTVGVQPISNILAGASVTASFNWLPPSISSTTMILARVNRVRGELAVDNNEKIRVFRVVAENGLVKVQYNKLTHQWIGLQARRMLPDGPIKTEILSHLGVFNGDCSVLDLTETGTTLLEGMWEEDCDAHFLEHFWDPDDDVGLPGFQSAIARAETLFPVAVNAYRGGDQERAYYVLGRVAHLLQDMAQPAHVHNDQHACCNDHYESQVESFHLDYVWDTPRDPSQTALISFLGGYPLKPVSNQELSFWRYSSSRDTPLFRLFLNLAETADFFESEDRGGDSDTIQRNQPATTISWHPVGQSAPATFSDAEARAHADTLLPLAMRYVAGLYQVFWDETHPPLTNGVAKTDSVAQGTWKFYSFFDVPAGATSLKVTTTNASGDVDLYVKFNQAPTDTVYDCRPFSASGNETCDFLNPSPGTWIIGVKGFAAGTHTYTVTATATVPSTVFQDNFESGPGGWFAQSPWEQTTTTSHSATHSWTDSPGGNYANNANTSLWSPILNFSSLNSATLTFWHRYDLEDSFDFGNVWVTTNNGVTFTQVASFTGTNTAWTQATINLDAFAGHPSVRVVFQVLSNSSITRDGWYIDDVAVNGTLLGSNTGPVDVFFIADLSSSFADELPIFQSQAADIIANLRASNSNIRFGLAKLEDYPISPFGSALAGDKAYQRVVDLTFNTDTVLNAISALFVRNGGDLPQSQLAALYQAATGAGENLSAVGFSGASIPAGQQASFRNGATKLLMLWTDAPFHQRGDPGGPIPYPGPTFAQTVDAINALGGAKFMGILSGSDGLIDLQNMAAATGSVAPSGGVDCNADGIIDIPGGAALACPIASTGAGLGDAILALLRAATVPSLSISDVTVTEGNTGTGNAVFTVSLSATSAQTVTVTFSTANGAATVGSDYVAKSGTLTFNPGDTTKTITVVVIGDTVVEPNETFFVNLTSISNAIITDGQGLGTIINDDPASASVAAPVDFDGDLITDVAVYQTSTGNWFYVRSTMGFGQHLSFGGANFLPVPGDFDGDGQTDTAVYDTTNGNWFIAQSMDGFRVHPSFGGAGFIPVPGDYDNDGKMDVAVYQTSTGHWFIVGSTAGFMNHLAFGGPGFVPVPADYDGDGQTDTAVYQTSTGNWFIAQSTAGFRVHPSFGGTGFIPVPGDYDNDGKIDVAVYQTGTGHWFVVGSTDGFLQHLSFGGPGYFPVPGDYDGDGQTDTAVYDSTNGNWFISQSTAGFLVHPSFGGTGFVPVLPQVTILRPLGLL